MLDLATKTWATLPDMAIARHGMAVAAVEKSGAKLVTLSTHAATLEDLFVSLTGRELRDV